VLFRSKHGQTKKGHSWSWGEKGVSYYCAHCATVLEIMAIEKAGYPAWLCNPQPDGHCIHYLYKDPWSVPEEYYERVGMKKAKRSAQPKTKG
jgi:hypothetical protein